MHGLAVLRWIEQTTQQQLQIEEGALYPALHRMEEKGWLDADWGYTEKNRKAKFYRLTAPGANSSRPSSRDGRATRASSGS